MPQVPRTKDGTTKAQEKEKKRAIGALSCAECRRLKLKCDKTIPCSSCKRRGCAQICPNGSLVTGQGTRFVLADTDRLHKKISIMSDRIRQLEDALAILQSTITREQHPLLARELLKIKSSLELHSAIGEEADQSPEPEGTEHTQYIDTFGTLAVSDDGASTFYGSSAGSESLLVSSSSKGESLRSGATYTRDLPPIIENLASSFPFSISINGIDIDVDYLVANYLPPWEEAKRLCDLYLEQAPWFYGAVTEKHLHEELLPLWYEEAPRRPLSTPSPPRHDQASPTPEIVVPTCGGAHDLAVMFMVFCFGASVDISLPPAPENPVSEQYYQVCQATLSLEPILERAPSVATIQTLSMMAIYQGMCAKENSIETTWILYGMATKLAQSIGLHRDCARWQLPPAEVQKRRALFWELFITDGWQSLATGRIATFSLPFVDCELPYDPGETMAEDGSSQPSFPHWKARFGAECVSAVIQATLTSRAPRYSLILELDRKIRDMSFPKYAQNPPPKGAGLAQAMTHFMPRNYRELTLLYVHRVFFAHALTSDPSDPVKSPYAPSFLAGYRSACELLAGISTQFGLFPAHIARFWVLWTHAFSAAFMLAQVVTRSPMSKVAPAALLELRSACDLFEKAAEYGGRAKVFLPLLQMQQQRAHQTYLDTHSGLPPTMKRDDIFTPRQEMGTLDELAVFSGKTNTVATKSASVARASSSHSSGSQGSPSPSNGDKSPPRQGDLDSAPRRMSLSGLHPTLMSRMKGFDGEIDEQLHNAYYANQNGYARSLMDIRHQQPMEGQQQTGYLQPLQPNYEQRGPTHTVDHHGSHHSASPITMTPQSYHAPISYTDDGMYPASATPLSIPDTPSFFHDTSYSGSSSSHLHLSPTTPVTQHEQYRWQSIPADASGGYNAQQSPAPQQRYSPMQQQGYSEQTIYDNPPRSLRHQPSSAAHPLQPQMFTPTNVLRGISEEDLGLQQTWANYNPLGVPRPFDRA